MTARAVNKPEITECPHCGNSEEYYTKDYVYGSTWYRYRFDGEEAENAELYEGLTFESGKYAYCSVCDKRLFKMEDNNG